jgi:hypothetical protein
MELALDPVIQTSISLALAMLWLTGGTWKAAHIKEFRVTFAEYRVMPRAIAAHSAVLAVGMELGLGIALCVPSLRSEALLASAVLLILYAAAIGANLMRGRQRIDCGCALGAHQPLSVWFVWRNLGLAAAAASVGLLPSVSRSLFWVDAVSIAAAIIVLAALYAATNLLIANAQEFSSLGS